MQHTEAGAAQGAESPGPVFGTVEQALADIAAGKFIVVADDEDRENEGDLVCAAELVTPEMVNFMLEAKGMICLAMTNAGRPSRPWHAGGAEHRSDGDRVHRLDRCGGQIWGDHRHQRVRSGGHHSCGRRSRLHTRRPSSAGPHPSAAGARRWVLQRVGHTEAAVDLARLAGCRPTGVICEVLNKDGTTARRPQLEQFCRQHGLTFITIAQLVAYRLKHERLVHRVAEARLPTEFGEWRIYGYRNDVDSREHIAITFGDVAEGDSTLVRMHSKCLTGDVFHSRRCDCGWQLETAMAMIQAEGRG